MEVLAALGLGAKELFAYNRENFKFDQDQRLEREALRLEMQVKRFELFREDVRDLVELTVDRMDVYHLVGALFLEFCIVLFCEGRVQASAPPFLLSLFLLSNACAFIYLLLAVWLSMHASIAAHSFGVRLLTRFVRLPIPSVRQMDALRSQLRDYEKQGVANLLRLPFQDRQEWKQVGRDEDDRPGGAASSSASAAAAASAAPRSPRLPARPGAAAAAAPRSRDRTPPRASPSPASYLVAAGAEPTGPPRALGPPASLLGRPMEPGGATLEAYAAPIAEEANGAAPPRRQGEDLQLLPEEADHPLGGEDLLTGIRGARPERHVQLFRQLQAKWQCYDAYCRVCMGLGVNQILQGLSYYCICHTLVENRSPTTGYALVVLFQCTTVALAVLDLAGLKRREIIAVQVIGIMPCALTAWGVAHGKRDARGVMDPEQDYMMSPLSFVLQVLWLELWLRVAAPSGEDTAKLPRRFRQILFLDVFGDAVGWDPSQAESDQGKIGDVLDHSLVDDVLQDEERDQEAQGDNEALFASAGQAASQLAMAQCAMRRWGACPEWSMSAAQRQEFEALSEKLKTWGSAVNSELERHRHHGGASSVFEPELRRWHDLSSDERRADPFAKCLLGPFEDDSGYTSTTYHYDVESSTTLYGDAAVKERPGALVLTLSAVATILADLEREARRLLELRVMRDLHAATRVQQAVARERRRGAARHRHAAAHLQRAAGGASEGRLPSFRNPAAAALASFPNLASIIRTRLRSQGPRARDQGLEPLTGSPRDGVTPAAAGDGSPSTRSRGRDPTLVAMAGQHAQHFVPERLPWQVLSRMTRVLQACWLWSGLMAFLKEAHVYQVDFQQHAGHERRLCALEGPLQFSPLRVEWPHGSFFRSQGLFCAAGGAGDFWVASPFALHLGNVGGGPEVLTLEEVVRTQLPPSTAMLCPPGAQLQGGRTAVPSACLFVAPSQDGGLVVWPAGQSPQGPQASALLLDGPPWREVAGGMVRCLDAQVLLPPPEALSGLHAEDAAGGWCLLLVGWDGELMPIALLPLPGRSGAPPANGTAVRPALDAPLRPADAARGVAALAVEPGSGRLWALLADGRLEAWDLLGARSLGRWTPDYGAVPFQPTALCEGAGGGLLVLGRSEPAGPRLAMAALPAGWAEAPPRPAGGGGGVSGRSPPTG